MSVICETSQTAMGPYVAVAAAASSLNAWTAAFRAASLVKVPGGEDGGDGEGGGGGGEGEGGGGEGDGGSGDGEGGKDGEAGGTGGEGTGPELARITGSHCGGHATS